MKIFKNFSIFEKFKINNFSPIIFLQKYNCMQCHKINKPSYGPSFMDISIRYQNKNKNKKYLFKKIKMGSTGSWGPDSHMPPNDLGKKYIKKIVLWILGLWKKLK